MQTSWLFFAVLSGLSSGAFNLTNRFSLKGKGDSSAYAWWFESLRFILFATILAVSGVVVTPTSKLLFLLLSLGFAEVFAIYFLMKTHSETEISTSAVFLRSMIVWIPIFAFIFFGEKLSLFEYVGIGVIFSGLLIVLSPKKFKISKGIRYALGFALSGTIINIILKELSLISPKPLTLMAMSLPSMILFPIFMKGAKDRIKKYWKLKKSGVLTAISFDVVNISSRLFAYDTGAVSKVAGTFHSIAIVFTVLSGIIFLGERNDIKRKISGMIAMLIGIWLLV